MDDTIYIIKSDLVYYRYEILHIYNNGQYNQENEFLIETLTDVIDYINNLILTYNNTISF